MQLTPVIAVQMTAALAALVLGPVALWARRGSQQRLQLHRGAGYAWVTLGLGRDIAFVQWPSPIQTLPIRSTYNMNHPI